MNLQSLSWLEPRGAGSVVGDGVQAGHDALPDGDGRRDPGGPPHVGPPLGLGRHARLCPGRCQSSCRRVLSSVSAGEGLWGCQGK